MSIFGCDCAAATAAAAGDHEQLRPKPQYYPLEASSGRGYDLDVSAFERLASSGTIPVVTLQEQRRMRPDISRWACVAAVCLPSVCESALAVVCRESSLSSALSSSVQLHVDPSARACSSPSSDITYLCCCAACN
jgi:hypothetical protein